MFRKKIKETSGEPAQNMFDRPFWKFFGNIGDFFLLTVYWVLTSIPLVTLGVSTSALFYVCLKKRRHEEEGLWHMYIKSFKANLKQGIFLWLLYVFIALDVFLIGFTMVKTGILAVADVSQGGKYWIAICVAAMCYIALMLYTAALQAMFKQTSRQCLTAAVALTFSQLPSTLLFLLIIAVLGLFTFYIFPPLIFIDIPLSVYFISIRMNTIFTKQISKTEKAKEENQKEGKSA